jgi:hypothetical protein
MDFEKIYKLAQKIGLSSGFAYFLWKLSQTCAGMTISDNIILMLVQFNFNFSTI